MKPNPFWSAHIRACGRRAIMISLRKRATKCCAASGDFDDLLAPLRHPEQTSYQIKRSKQFDKKAASQPHTNGSVVFARLQQCTPHVIRVHNANGISIGSAVFAGFMSVTDRPTDRPCYSVCNSRPHLRTYYVVLRCGLSYL